MAERAIQLLVLVAMVMAGVTGESSSAVCKDECASHRNGSYHCANSHCSEFPDAPDTTQNIYLQHNEIRMLPPLAYPQLILLNLTENSLTELPADAFAQCTVLRELYIAANAITTFTTSSFHGLEDSLEKLDLSHNAISELGIDPFMRLRALKFLNLNYNGITSLGATSLSDIQSLTFLHLMGNKLKVVDYSSFLDLPELVHVDLRENALTTIGEKTFSQCAKLEIADFFNNSISKIEPDAFKYAENLQTIHLQHNSIRVLEQGTFDNMGTMGGKLQSVYLDHNPLELIPPKVFPRTVTRISLNNMAELSFIDEDAFAQIHHIDELMINNNPKLGRIHEKAFGDELKTPVAVIQLTNNSLTSLSEGTFVWESVKVANLRHNPWQCDCNMRWMVEEESQVPPEVKATVFCETPDYLKGKSVGEVPSDQFSCAWYANYERRIIRGLILLVLVGSIALVLGCLFKHRNRLLSRCTNSDFRYKTVGFNPARAGDSEVDIDLYRGKKSLAGGQVQVDHEEI